MTFESRSQSAPSMRVERTGAWTLVAAIHFLFAWMATRPSPVVEFTDAPMTLVYIDLPRHAPGKMRSVKTPSIPSAAPIAARPDQPPKVASSRASLASSAASPALQVTTADDHWDTPASTSKSDPVRIAKTNPMHRNNPIQMGPPERFRMRKQLSPADIVRIISMGLFWPPGYTDDPCPGLEKAVQMLTGASTPRQQRILEDAVKQQDRYCS